MIFFHVCDKNIIFKNNFGFEFIFYFWSFGKFKFDLIFIFFNLETLMMIQIFESWIKIHHFAQIEKYIFAIKTKINFAIRSCCVFFLSAIFIDFIFIYKIEHCF